MTGRKLGLLFSVLILVFPLNIHAQSATTGALAGSVADAKGAPVSNAQIEIALSGGGSTMRTVVSDAGGNFIAASLPVGIYDILVKASGFSTGKYSDVAVRLTETTRFNPSLVALQSQFAEGVPAPPDQTDRVMVISAPPVVVVETSSPTTGRSVEADVIGKLPLATQNFHQLLSLSPGADSKLNASAELGRGTVGINVNGQRQDNNNYLVDGISVTDLRNF